MPSLSPDAPSISAESALDDAIAGLAVADASADDLDAAAMLLVEAMLAGEETALRPAAARLRRALGAVIARSDDHAVGRIEALLSITAWVLDRLAPKVIAQRIEPDSHLHRFLEAVVASPGVTSSDLGSGLGVASSEVSRLGRIALNAGLVRKQRLGRSKRWEATPRGEGTLDVVRSRKRSAAASSLPPATAEAQVAVDVPDVRELVALGGAGTLGAYVQATPQDSEGHLMVAPAAGGWAVRSAGQTVFAGRTKDEVVARAREAAREQQGELVILGVDGRMLARHTYS